MDMQFHNVALNSETSLLLETLKGLCHANDIPVEAVKKAISNSKGGEIIIDLIVMIGGNVTSAFVYDLLKSAFKRVFGKGGTEDEVKIEIKCDNQEEAEIITSNDILEHH